LRALGSKTRLCETAWEHLDGQQVGLGRLAEILIVSRNVLVIRLDDGTEIKLVR